MNTLFSSIRKFQHIEKDFKLVKSSGKFNELCKLLTFILNYTKISAESMKVILAHTIDSLSEQSLTIPIFTMPGETKTVKAKGHSLNLKVDTKRTEKINYSERQSLVPDIVETPQSISSIVYSPTERNKSAQLKPSKTQNSILSVSFASPSNESIHNKLKDSKYSFSKQDFR